MNRCHFTLVGRIGLGLSLMAILSIFQPLRAQQVQGEIEVQTRGPLHEAFAELAETAATPALVVPKQAPDPINEIPPDVKPDGDVVWIPGYWAWDDERNDFLWVSGVWRVPPPGATWVPGYWTAVQGGFQWVPGFWTTQEELTYLPSPPPSLERGPTSPPPGDNFFYVPGSWVLVDGQYAWQPGFWTPYQTGWVWVNTRYVWTPSGYCHIAGRWDYPLDQRGYCFAPAYFGGQAYLQPGFAYRPNIILNTTLLTTMLFARPRYGSYYFGDYYGANYAQAGFQPWYNYRHFGSTPNSLYAYERWSNRLRDPNWDTQLRGEFDRRALDESARPPRDWTRWQERNRDRANAQATAGSSLFVSVEQAASQIVNDRRWVARPADDPESGEARAREIRALQDQRRQMELQSRSKVAAGTPSGSPITTDPQRVNIKPSLKLRLPESATRHSVLRPTDERGNEPQVGTSPAGPTKGDRSDRPDRAPGQTSPLTTTPPATKQSPTTPPSTTQPPATSQPTGVPQNTPQPQVTPPPGTRSGLPMVNPPTSQTPPRDDRPGRPDRPRSIDPKNTPPATDPKNTPPSTTPRAIVPGTPSVVPPTTPPSQTQPPQGQRPQNPASQPKNPMVRPPSIPQPPAGKQPSSVQPPIPKQPMVPSPGSQPATGPVPKRQPQSPSPQAQPPKVQPPTPQPSPARPPKEQPKQPPKTEKPRP